MISKCVMLLKLYIIWEYNTSASKLKFLANIEDQCINITIKE